MTQFYLTKDGVRPKKRVYLSPTSKGHGIAFDSMEGVQENGDPVAQLCSWCLTNLTPEQCQALCAGLQPTDVERPRPAGMDDEGYERTGPSTGPGGACPWPTGKKASAGAQDGWTRFRDVVKKEERDLSFDAIYAPSAGTQDSGRDDLSLDALIGGGLGYDAGESTPRYNHLGSLPPLWVTVR